MLEQTIGKNFGNESVSVHGVGPGDYVRICWDWKIISKIDFGENGRYEIYVKPDKKWFEFWKGERKYSCFDIEVRGFAKKL